jgi:peptidoglycan/LPS O-acetylase OafA/YrhL
MEVSRTKMKRIHEFEALRGLLALWVVIGHVLTHGGYTRETLGPILSRGDLAVDVFIILSGFVIFDLLDSKRETFADFITRRFFRIFPIYVVALLAGYFLAGHFLAWLMSIPWKTQPVAASIAFAASSKAYLNQNLLAHLTALHGLIPNFMLPYADVTILPPAWSISVEWQFYLVAPLLYFLLRRRPLVLAVGIIGLIALHSRYWLDEGFAVNHADSFLVGIVCYFAYKNSPYFRWPNILIGTAVAIAGAAWFAARPLPLTIWAAFMALALHSKYALEPNAASSILASRPLQTLGRISYSIYLLHLLVLFAVSSVTLTLHPGISQLSHLLIVAPMTVLLTIVLSRVTFALIEKPGMALGRRIVDRSAIGKQMPLAESA